MRDLLPRAGFRIRSGKRADCAHCTGRSTGTVAYTEQVAYCHRCHISVNRVALERLLGLGPAQGPRPRPTPSEKAQRTRQRQAEALLAAFQAWWDWKLREIANCERRLHVLRKLLCEALARNPGFDLLWALLADVHAHLRRLEAAWEFFWRDPLPQYRPQQATISELHEVWLAAQALLKQPV